MVTSEQIKKLPDSPGVYFFLSKKGKILYIGKATSIRDRVKSYFSQDILMTRSPLIAKMLEEANKVKFFKTDSVLEALLLESNQIKKNQPPYNSKEKDDKSYNYITITKEDFPRVLITRGSGSFGPYPKGGELKEALKIIRKIFPFRDKCLLGQSKPCFNVQIGLCPGVCIGKVSKVEYRRNIRNLALFLSGRRSQILKNLRKSMTALAKIQKFEEANGVKRQIFALEHIQDIALLKHDLKSKALRHGSKFRIEAYDIAHLSGKDVVGVMTVIEDGEPTRSQYRKFKIRADKNNDPANLKEIVTRRLSHQEWTLPDLVVVDGGQSQIRTVQKVLKDRGIKVGVVSVVKDARHKARAILNSNIIDSALHRKIFLANAEAHRFSISYHRKLRGKKFRI